MTQKNEKNEQPSGAGDQTVDYQRTPLWANEAEEAAEYASYLDYLESQAQEFLLIEEHEAILANRGKQEKNEKK